MDDIYHPKNGCELKSVVLGREASRKKSSSASSCSVRYRLEGQLRNPPHPWNPIENRSTLEAARRDEQDYRSWMDESGWRDFRIVEVTITEKPLPPNNTEQP